MKQSYVRMDYNPRKIVEEFYLCDICGDRTAYLDRWSGSHQINETGPVFVKHENGDRDGGGMYKIQELHFCPVCMETKVLPTLCAQFRIAIHCDEVIF